MLSFAPNRSPWPRLEALFDALAAVGEASPVREVLAAARDTLAADAVFFDPGSTGEPFAAAGTPGLTADWGRATTAWLLSQSDGPDRERLLADVPPPPGDGPAPRSAVMVCLSRTRRAWLAAVRFAADRPFGLADVRHLSFVRRVYANHVTEGRAKEELKAALFGLVHCLSSAIDAKDPYTAGHSERVARMAARLGEQLGLPAAVRSDLYLAGLLHDIGKIGVSDAVLRKPGPLTDEEFAAVKTHPVIGEKIVANVRQLKHLCPGVRWHHERVDGKGYPDGVGGDALPLLPRVLAVADTLDAMTSARPYRETPSIARVEQVLRAGAGTQWDAGVVDAFFACRPDLYAIRSRGLGDSVAVAIAGRTGAFDMATVQQAQTVMKWA